jgi:hypothetical protein
LLNKIKDQNIAFFNDLQNLVNLNSSKANNDILNQKAKDIEENSLKLFSDLNEIKKVLLTSFMRLKHRFFQIHFGIYLCHRI